MNIYHEGKLIVNRSGGDGGGRRSGKSIDIGSNSTKLRLNDRSLLKADSPRINSWFNNKSLDCNDISTIGKRINKSNKNMNKETIETRKSNNKDINEGSVSDISGGSSSDNSSSEEDVYITYHPQDNPYMLITRRIDSGKIRRKNRKDLKVCTRKASDIRLNSDNPNRSGAIIYTNINGDVRFCLGVDTQSGDLTDFGGGIKKGESVIEGGLRELKEESQGVFGYIDPDHIADCISIHSHNMAIMFIPLQVNPYEISQKFIHRINKKKNPEVSSIMWLNMDEFFESIHGRGRRIYSRVRRLLSKAIPTINDLCGH